MGTGTRVPGGTRVPRVHLYANASTHNFCQLVSGQDTLLILVLLIESYACKELPATRGLGQVVVPGTRGIGMQEQALNCLRDRDCRTG
eukprot:1239444-Rhodomonas_salina.1